MLKGKTDQPQIITRATLFSFSQWVTFPVYEWLPKFPRFAPNSFMLSPLSFFHVYISWHNHYETSYPHSKQYRMMRSISTNNLDEVVNLLENGFPLNDPIENKYGYNCLQMAAINNHYPLIEILLLRGADVNKGDKWGNTPLHLAIVNQNHEAINSLMRNGSDPMIKNKYGVSAFDKASNSPNILNFIQKYKQTPRNFPRFRVKLKFQQRLKHPFWQKLSSLKIYSPEVHPNLMSKWQFDFTRSRTVSELASNDKQTK